VSIWTILGLERTRDARDIRRAYARQLKVTQPEDDPAGFKALREAYDAALEFSRHGYEAGDGGSIVFPGNEDEAFYVSPEPVAPNDFSSRSEPLDEAANTAASDWTAFLQRRDRLVALLEADPPARPQALELAVQDLITAPALLNVDLRRKAEFLMARTIIGAGNAAEPIIDPLTAAFKWRDDIVGELGGLIRQIEGLRQARRYLRELRLPRHPFHIGYKALQAPPPRSMVAFLFKPSPVGPIASIIERLNWEFPELQDEFPYLAAWEDWLETPRLSSAAIWTAFLAAAPVGVLLWIMIPERTGPGLVAAIVGGFFITMLLAAARLVLVSIPRQAWRREWARRLPDWVAIGWAPLSLMLLPIGAAVAGVATGWPPQGPGTWAVAGLAAVCVATLWWCAVTGEPDTRESAQPWWVRLAIQQAYYLIWIGLLLFTAPAIVWPMIPALLTGAAVTFAGSRTLLEQWGWRLGVRGRLATLALMAVMIVTAMVLLFRLGDYPGLAPGLIALCAVLVLMSRPMVEGIPDGAATLRHWTGWLGLIGLINAAMRAPAYTLVLSCLWIIAGAAIVCVGAFIEAREDARTR
jgi:hypothetical protein